MNIDLQTIIFCDYIMGRWAYVLGKVYFFFGLLYVRYESKKVRIMFQLQKFTSSRNSYAFSRYF